ncbi:potassium transporter peripheral membrane component [Streptococcus lutetiensis 033]|uniref:Potassium transporter peripheral membrane component n=1 Tax=Streptococcus lutetiensis 033 TaxID=1076934 RepID=A0AB33ANR8_9STRE|nr:potassium transporter peripheral membrane component [Streptococcus lutetiensis 033]
MNSKKARTTIVLARA